MTTDGGEDDFIGFFRWYAKGAFIPVGHAVFEQASRTFAPGQQVVLSARLPRSVGSHKEYFLEIAQLFGTLPERLAHAPYARNTEALRKHALISTGFATTHTHVASSRAEAERTAAVVHMVHREYCITQIERTTLLIHTAESQAMKAMGKTRFEASKSAVLGWIRTQIEDDGR